VRNKFHFVYKFLPVYVEYVDKIPNYPQFAGKCYWFWIKIKKDHADDIGLLEHELQHTRQMYKSLGIFGILYKFSKKWRQKLEVEAFKVQLSYAKEGDENRVRDVLAGHLARNYNLDLSHGEAIELLAR
jgi:hypothetical protein